MSVKNTINRYLRKFHVELHGTGYLQSLVKNEFKSNEQDFFLKIFEARDSITIFDVGANKGLTVEQFIKLFPMASIHAFEPYPIYAKALDEKYHSHKHIKVNQSAISDCQGEKILNINRSIDTSSLLCSAETGLNSDRQVKTIDKALVKIDTIDNYIDRNNVSHIHILKLDIQGSELHALKGSHYALAAKKIDLIYTECYFVQQYENQPLFHEIAGLLLEYDYVIQDIYHPIYGNSRLAWCDALFLRRDLKLIS